MGHLHIELPATFSFATEIPVRITDINYGGHLGNDTVLSLLHEARVRFLNYLGFSEVDVGGCGLLLTDAAIAFRKEVVYGETLRIEVGLTGLRRSGFTLAYRVTEVSSGQVAVEAQTGMVFFDYRSKKMVRAPEQFVAVAAT